MANYDAYVLATVLPPLIIVSVLLLISYSIWGVSYFVYSVQKKRAEQSEIDTVIEYPGLQYMYMVLQPVFGNRLQARRTRNRVKIKLYGQKISPIVIPALVQLVGLALGLSFAVFVTVFIVDIGQVCDEKLDCFPFNYSQQVRPLVTDPIQNCSVYKSNNISITCFHFAIQLVDALRSSGGILALTTIGLNFYLTLVFMLAQVQCCRQTGLCGCLMFFVVGCMILLSTLLWILPLGLAQGKTLESVVNWESVLVYYYTILYLLLVATLLPCCVPHYRRDFRMCCTRTQRRYRAARRQETDSEDDEIQTPYSSPETQQRSTGYNITCHQHTSQSRQTAGYYGSVDEHPRNASLTHRSNEASSGQRVVQSSDIDPQSSGTQSSGTLMASGAQGSVSLGDRKSPVVYRQHSTRSVSKKASKLTKRMRGGYEGGRGRGKHGADVKKWNDLESEEEWSTTSGHLDKEDRHKTDTNESLESSAGELEVEYGSQGAEGRGRRVVRGVESTQIRAVLTGGTVENGERRGDASIHTHL